MADKIDKIPEGKRWALATQGLTGAYAAISTAFQSAVGQEKFEEFNGALWFEAGKGAKEFADNLGMATENADDIEAVTQCPWNKRWKEQEQGFDSCGAGHQRWGDGAVQSLNPDFQFRLTKNMNRGDAHCEWVVERKK